LLYQYKQANLSWQNKDMLTENQLQLLRSENELLLIQLEDINQVIREREEELTLLRETACEARAMQSRLDMNLLEFEQMQLRIGDQQQESSGFNQRMSELEEELYASIKEQLQHADTVKDYKSVKANLQYTELELQEASGLYIKLDEWQSKYAESESNLEIARMEIANLKEELQEIKELNELLRNKKLQ